jgi:hypothetical protein
MPRLPPLRRQRRIFLEQCAQLLALSLPGFLHPVGGIHGAQPGFVADHRHRVARAQRRFPQRGQYPEVFVAKRLGQPLPL